MKKAFVFDLDGTLLNAENELTPALISGLNELRTRGHQCIIATGRTYGEVLEIIQNQPFDAYISSNSMSIYDANRQPLQRLLLPPLLLPKIIQAAGDNFIYYELRKNVGQGLVMSQHKAYMEHMLAPDRPLTVSDHEWHSRKDAVPLLEHLQPDDFEETVKIYFFHPDPLILQQWRDTLAGLIANTELSMESSSPNSCEIVHRQANKGNGLQFLVEKGMLQQQDIICFGDSFNDLSMFEYAPYAVAMLNAAPEVKLQANEVTAFTNGENGVLQWLQKYLK